jgi:APA family basic amino acid/polyamine antiporter
MPRMTGLKRRLGRIDALAISLGAVIGVGVFHNTGLVLTGAGGFAGATLLWTVIGFVCLTGSILYSDLSARVPEAGGGYSYVRVAFGGPASFLYGWMNAGVAIPVRQATVYSAIGDKLSPWIPLPTQLIAALAMLLLATLTLSGVRAGAIAQRVFTTGKLATILLVIALSIVLGWTGAGSTTSVAVKSVTFATAVSAVWFTLLGWQDVVLLAEELHQPRRDLPVVLITTVVLTAVLYLAIHITIFVGLGGGAEAYGEWPAIDVATRVFGAFGAGLLSVLMLSSMFGVAAEGLLVRPRIAMALARDGMGPRPIAAVSRTGTPYGSLLLLVAIVLLLLATNSFRSLLPMIAFTQGFLGIFETASYFVVRRKRPELPTSRFHPWAPLVFIVVNAALCVLSARDNPFGAGLCILLLAGFTVAYLVVRMLSQRIPQSLPAAVATYVAPEAAAADADAGSQT